MNDKWYNSDFAAYLGQGLCLLFICLGIGTCSMLDKAKVVYVKEPEQLKTKIVP